MPHRTRLRRPLRKKTLKYDRLEQREMFCIQLEGTITSDMTLNNPEGYCIGLLGVTIAEGVTVTVAPGIDIFTSNPNRYIYVEGTLRGADFSFSGDSSVVVNNGGRLEVEGADIDANFIQFDSGSFGFLQNSLIKSGSVELYSSGVAIDNNTFSTIDPLYSDISRVDQFYDNTFTVDTLMRLEGTLVRDLQIQALPNLNRYSLWLTTSIPTGRTLTIDPGIKFSGRNSIPLTVSGTLIARDMEFLSSTSAIDVNNGGYIDFTRVNYNGSAIYYYSGSRGRVVCSEFNTNFNLYAGSSVVMHTNSFLSGRAIGWGSSSATIDFSQIYWGTTSVQEIESRISDRNDSSSRPLIAFNPFLTMPHYVGQVTGTPQADTMSFSVAPDAYVVTLNGQEYLFGRDCFREIRIAGGDGHDTLDVYFPTGNHSLQTNQGDAVLTGADYTFLTGGFETSRYHAGEGQNTVVHNESHGLLNLEINPQAVILSGAQIWREFRSFDNGTWNISQSIPDTQVQGTTGDDSLEVATNSLKATFSNGAQVNIQGPLVNLLADFSQPGNDSLKVVDSTQDDTLTATPQTVTWDSSQRSFEFQDFESVLAVAQAGGVDTAFLYDSAGNDILTMQAAFSLLTGPGFQLRFEGFERVTAEANQGGVDSANLHDSTANDSLTFNADGVQLTRTGFLAHARQFEQNVVHGSNGGFDTAVLDALAADDWFNGGDISSLISAGQVAVEVRNFEKVTARAQTANTGSLATLTGGNGNDQGQLSRLKSTLQTPTRLVEAEGFARIRMEPGTAGQDRLLINGTNLDDLFEHLNDEVSVSTNAAIWGTGTGFDEVEFQGASGNDQAILRGTAGNDNFVGRPDSVVFSTTGRVYRVSGSEQVQVWAGTGGNDQATLHDSAGNDRFFASSTSAQMSGTGFFLDAVGFPQVTAVSSAGRDQATLRDTSGNDTYEASPSTARLFGSGYSNTAQGFFRVNAIATEGFDMATMSDSAGADRFIARPISAYLRSDHYLVYARGFDRVTATATAGDDFARLIDSSGDDRLLVRDLYSQLWGANFWLRAQGFERNSVLSSGAGNDYANIYDTAGNDEFGASLQAGWLTAASYYVYFTGFTTVDGRGVFGGINRWNAGPVTYTLNKIGNWI